MAFFDTLSETVSNAGKAFSNKTKEVAGSTKINLQLSQEEAKIKKAYAALGKAYFEDHEEDVPEQYAIYVADIKESLARMDALSKDKNILTNRKRCVECGEWMPNQDKFCGKCGAENEVIEKEEEVEAEAQEEDIWEEDVIVEEVTEEAEAVEESDDGTKTCANCDAKVKKDLLYCPECGEKF